MMTTNLTRLDPFSIFDDMMRSMRSPLSQDVQRNAGFVPAVDAHREDEDLVLAVDLPGVDPEQDLSVELSGRTLTISGERRSRNDAEGLREIRYGRFSRTVTLPAEVAEESISADYTDGVLSVRVSGVYAEEKPRKISITAGTRSEHPGSKDQVKVATDEKQQIAA